MQDAPINDTPHDERIHQLEAELAELRRENQQLKYARETDQQEKQRVHLEELVADRTQELSSINEQLRKEITEREQAEEIARQHQEKLAHVARINTVGEMASGLAHEINQPLAAIATYTQGCLHRLRKADDDPQKLGPILEQIIVQAQRAATIVQHLRNFVTKGKPHREPTDITQVVRRAVSLVRGEILSNEIKLDILQDATLPLVNADAIQVEQVILNLLRNAIDALSEVKEGVESDRKELKIMLDCCKSQEISITISDTGPGFSDDTRDKLSSPFFSTKPEGMGLGLAISTTIIEDHGGRLSHEVNDAGGATFRFTLPANGRRSERHAQP